MTCGIVGAGDPEMAELARDEMEVLQQQIEEQVCRAMPPAP